MSGCRLGFGACCWRGLGLPVPQGGQGMKTPAAWGQRPGLSGEKRERRGGKMKMWTGVGRSICRVPFLACTSCVSAPVQVDPHACWPPLQTCCSNLVILTPAVSPSLAHYRRTLLIPAPTKVHACWPPHQLDPTPAGPYPQYQLPSAPGLMLMSVSHFKAANPLPHWLPPPPNTYLLLPRKNSLSAAAAALTGSAWHQRWVRGNARVRKDWFITARCDADSCPVHAGCKVEPTPRAHHRTC